MRLEDCKLDVGQVVMAPPRRTEPDPNWVQGRDSGVLPEPVFQFYEQAEYLSFGAAPPFLADADNVLFGYFGESIRDSLVEAEEHRQLLIQAQGRTYDIGKQARGEPWDPRAPEIANREFRYFLLSLQAALDAIADITAILLTGLVPGLRVGRAQFSKIETWLTRPLPAIGFIVTPTEHFLRQLHETLQPLVHPDSPERDWLPLMRLYRNKAAHLGSSVFRKVGLHDDSGRFYVFIPRQWPYLWERYLKPAGERPPGSPTMPELFRETLIHQDLVSYVGGLQGRVTSIVAAAVSLLWLAYQHMKKFPPNQAALAELNGSSESYAFEYFVNERGLSNEDMHPTGQKTAGG